MTVSRLEKLQQRREALDAQIQATQARQRAHQRKQDTRRKVLVGAAVLTRAEQDATFKHELERMLDGFLTRAHERTLFGLATPENPT